MRSGLGYTIYEPTGFFNDMDELFMFAQKYGVVPLFGDGLGVMNPISALDLGEDRPIGRRGFADCDGRLHGAPFSDS